MMKSLWGQGNKYLRISRRSIDVSPKLAKLLLILIFILIGIFFVTGNVGLWNLWRAQKEIKGLQARIDLLEKRNTYLSVEIEQLKTDPYAVEKILREKFMYIRPGDKVYRFKPSQEDEFDNESESSFLDTTDENP
jgi:cell division protein FtsB